MANLDKRVGSGFFYRDVIGRWNGEKLEDGNHGFRDGDLVWAKVKGHPWWPGQIYDPRNASEIAVKHSQEGRILVAFFGDGSCSWCLPSQVVPFVKKFNKMSSNEKDEDGLSSSESLVNAVEKAVDEVGRVVELRLTCKCVQNKDRLSRPVAENAGVKAGVLVPEVDIDRFCIPEYEPDEILTKVLNLAKGVPVGNAFELGILRSSLSVFYNAKCGRLLPVYNDLKLSIEVPGGKQRSVAESMRKRNEDEPKRKKKESVNGSSPKRLKTSLRERKKSNKIRHVTFADEIDVKEISGGGSRKTNGLVVDNAKRLSFSESDIKLISDVGPIKAKLDIMIETLESYSKIPSKEKERLKEETKGRMEYVVTASNPYRI